MPLAFDLEPNQLRPTDPDDRVRIQHRSGLGPRLAQWVSSSSFERYLADLSEGRALDPREAAAALFTLRDAGLTRGERTELRKYILQRLPTDRRALHRSQAATCRCPEPHHIVQLLLAATFGREGVPMESLPDVQRKLVQLRREHDEAAEELKEQGVWVESDPFYVQVRADARERRQELGLQISTLEAIAEGFEAMDGLPAASEQWATADGLVRLLREPLQRLQTQGRGVAPERAAVLDHTLKTLRLEPEALEALRAAILQHLPTSVEGSAVDRAEGERFVERASAPELVRVFTGEALGRPPLPLDRGRLTDLISEVQGRRGDATRRRALLLDGRSPGALPAASRTGLDRIDGEIRQLSSRLDELKAARRGVQDVRGQRWLDSLEVDVLVGGAVGVPGVISGSVMGGVQIGSADPSTGAREKGVAGYLMPAMSVGGYGKLDFRYDRTDGLSLSGGGGADFLGIWGGPGGKSWGNVFAGGIWIPQVVNVGAGYGVDDEQAYGALILSTFWPPFSTAAGRVDTVIRHPDLAVGAETMAEWVRDLSESPLVAGGRALFEKAADAVSDGVEPFADALREFRFDLKASKAADGLPESDEPQFVHCLRVLRGPTGGDAANPREVLETHRRSVQAILPRLEDLSGRHPEHLETQWLRSAAHHVVGDGPSALRAAERGLDLALASGSERLLEQARENFVGLGLSHGAFAQVWPVLGAWLDDTEGVRPQLHLVAWLGGQGRQQEAKQLAEGLLHRHPRSFEVQRVLSAVSGAPPEAEIPT